VFGGKLKVRGYTEKQVEKAKEQNLSLFKWEMDKRFVADLNDQCKITITGTMTAEKASRIFRIIQEKES
jgi:broad-specificity NMP kinase